MHQTRLGLKKSGMTRSLLSKEPFREFYPHNPRLLLCSSFFLLLLLPTNGSPPAAVECRERNSEQGETRRPRGVSRRPYLKKRVPSRARRKKSASAERLGASFRVVLLLRLRVMMPPRRIETKGGRKLLVAQPSLCCLLPEDRRRQWKLSSPLVQLARYTAVWTITSRRLSGKSINRLALSLFGVQLLVASRLAKRDVERSQESRTKKSSKRKEESFFVSSSSS